MGSICENKVVHKGDIEVHGGQLVDKGLLDVALGVAQRLHSLLPRQLHRLLQALDVHLWEALRTRTCPVSDVQ